MPKENEMQDQVFKDIIEVPGLARGKRFFINTGNGRWVTLDDEEYKLFQDMKANAAWGGSAHTYTAYTGYTRLECKLEAAGLIRSAGIPRKLRLMELQLGITSDCNLKCVHCLAGNHLAGHQSATGENRFMPLARIAKILSEAQAMGVETISITGGEPFLHPGIRDIVKLAAEKKFKRFSIATNGTRLTGETIRFLAHHQAGLNLSCDSLEKSTYERIRINAAFDRFLESIELIKKTDLNITLNFTINRLNQNEIPDFFKWAAEHRFKYIQFSTLLPLGRGNENYSRLRVTGEDLKEAWKNILHLSRVYRKSVNVREIELLRERIRFGNRNSCTAGVKVAYIDPAGRLFPCHFLHLDPAINLEKTRLHEAWEHAPNLTAMRGLHVLDILGCSTCPFKAICGGGCRAGLPHLRAFPLYCPKETIVDLLEEEQ